MIALPELTLRLALFLACVGLFTAAAAVWDLRTRRIPNKLTLPMFVLGLGYQAVFHGWGGLGDAALAFLAGFGTLFVLWVVGGGGGGDVKLMGALSVWLGFWYTLYVLVASTVFVILATTGVLVWSIVTRGTRKTKAKYLATGKDEHRPRPETIVERQKRRIMAYAAPVALATWTILIWKLPEL